MQIGIDAIHGNGLCYEAIIYPTAIGQASTFDTLLVKKAAEKTTFEISATGSHWTFTPDLLAYDDAEMNYGVEKGTFTLMLGSSSRDEDLRDIQLAVR